jgi:cytoskeletal protein RodZ
VSTGDTLAEARRQAGLTVSQVSHQTRIRETIIRGIERGDFSACGGDFYARGHIRSIAKAVGLDPDQVIREYDLAHGAPQAIRAAEVFEPSTPIKMQERHSLNWSVAMIVALAVIISFAVYHVVSSGSSPAHSVADQSSAASHPRPVKSSSAPPATNPVTSTVSKELVIKLVVTSEPCWVGFTSLTGAYVTQATLPAGSTKTWTFKYAVDMTIGNPDTVVLTVNGKNRISPGTETNAITLPFHPVKQLLS